MRTITKIIIHCTATREDVPVTVAQVDKWHRQRGWNGIGYHYLVYLDGSVHPGRSEDVVGAHTAGHNAESIGVCYVGGIGADGRAKDTRTPAQKASLAALVKQLRTKYPQATVHGHNEFAAKACPCFNVQQELNLYM